MMIDFSLIAASIPALIRGAMTTLQIASMSCLIGIGFGTLLGIAHSSSNWLSKAIIGSYVTLIRGTPMLIQIVFVFNVLPQLGISMSAYWAAVLAIGLNSSAYISQIVRAGIASVGKGQIEAGKVLGLSMPQITRYIVLPQAFALIIPSLGNELITLVKDSSLASIIGVMELTKEGSIITSRTLDALSIYTAVATGYLIITSALSLMVHFIEKRMNRHVRA